MKLKRAEFVSRAERLAREAGIFFFCGPDEAGAGEAATRLALLLPDPGERVEISGSDLRKDPARLGDEARSSSLFGDTRHIWVRANGDEAHDAVKTLLETGGDTCPVIIVATSATDKSRTAKLLEKRDDAVVAVFWPPEMSDVTASIRQMADSLGLRFNSSLAEQLARNCSMDVRLAHSELEKLALYLDASPQSPRTVESGTLDDIGADTEEDGMMPLVNAVLSGQTARLATELRRADELSLNPVAIVLQVERRATQLAQITAKIGRHGQVRSVVEAEAKARRIFWRDKGDIMAQLKCWNGARLDRLLERLLELHRTLLGNSQSAPLLMAQELTEICRFSAHYR
ncbi:MAG: DNA polymerase III subunit delta [Sphingomonadaceae bacterium]